MLRKATRGKELTLELARNEETESVSWGGSFWSAVGQSSLRTALSEIRGDETKTSLYAAGDNLANVLHIEGSISQIDRCGGLIHVHREDPGTDFPMEILVRNRHLPNAYFGARYPCSHKFASADKDVLVPAGTVQHVFFVDGTENSAHPGGVGPPLDVLKRSQIQPLLDALKPYKKYPFSSVQLLEDGLYMVCDSSDEQNFRFGLGQLQSGVLGEMRNDIIIFAGHVVYQNDGEPMLVIGDQLLPVDCLFSLDRKPRLIILAGCGPEQDAHMSEAPRRLMRGRAPGSCAYGVISAAYPVQFDASVALIQRLLRKMVRAQGREHLDELLRQAREETLRRVEDADRDILAYRYFGSCAYKPALLIERTSWRSAALVCAALVAALSLAWAIPAVRTAAGSLFGPAMTNAPGAANTAAPATTAEPGATGAIASAGPTAPAASPSFGEVVDNGDGTLRVTVHDCPESVALGVFLQVRGDASWYCKDAGMTREGEQFTVRWRAVGTNDAEAEKIALFLYPKSEVRTTGSYALVKARSIASKELTGLKQ